MIKALYVISRSGIPLIFIDYNKKSQMGNQETLFAGVITAIQSVMQNLDAGAAQFFETNKNEVYIELTEKFAIALIRDRKQKVDHKYFQDMLQKIATKLAFEHSIDEDTLLTKEDEDVITSTINDILDETVVQITKTEAAKKISDSLW